MAAYAGALARPVRVAATVRTVVTIVYTDVHDTGIDAVIPRFSDLAQAEQAALA